MKIKEDVQWITFLGPEGATFSHDAYNILAEIYKAPYGVTSEANHTYCHVASNNREIPSKIAKNNRGNGYGAIAMETKAEARVSESLEGFIDLLKTYDRLQIPGNGPSNSVDGCPMHIIGAVRLQLHFFLMVRQNCDLEALMKVFAHHKAAGACKKRLAASQFQIVDVPSNGEGARLIAQDNRYSNYAALGPRCAANKYSLRILDENCEDEKAITTFFLLAPRIRKVSTGTENRALIVFRLPHNPGALAHALLPFGDSGLNLIQIYSLHTGNGTCDFVIEIEVDKAQLYAFAEARAVFEKQVEKSLIFGPFEVLSR